MRISCRTDDTHVYAYLSYSEDMAGAVEIARVLQSVLASSPEANAAWELLFKEYGRVVSLKLGGSGITRRIEAEEIPRA